MLHEDSLITTACARLASGELVAIPTETVYGLAAVASNDEALKKIFSLKQRPFFDPLIVHVSNISQAEALSSDWNPAASVLVKRFWPGPLSIVCQKRSNVSSLITSGLSSVAVRWSAHPLLQKLLVQLGEPVAAPSANRFGKTSPSCADHVRTEFPGEDLLILDGGPCTIGIESTVVSVEAGNIIEILRPGAIGKAALELALREAGLKATVHIAKRDSASASPGRLEHHYMPNAPLALVDAKAGLEKVMALVRRHSGPLAPRKVRQLALSPDPALAARELYAEMRRLCDEGADFLWMEAPKSDGEMWAAILDRVSRAASFDWRS